MKIYTLTFSCTRNVGAALQEYALYKFLEKQGYKAAVVDYRPDFFWRHQSVLFDLFHDATIKKWLLLPFTAITAFKFNCFSKKHITMTARCRTIKNIEQLCQPDIYIAGSDQIWNGEITGYDDGYFLNFSTKAYKIAYAASVGNDFISELGKETLMKKIGSFNDISVREHYLKECLEENGKERIKQVLDPVFLLNKEDFPVSKKRYVKYKYLLLYITAENEVCYNAARKLAEIYQLKIVQINRINNRYGVDKVLPCVSPDEFVRLITEADFVVTNSFHGTAMSIVLEKSFYAVKLKNRNSRLESLLFESGLVNRLITKVDDIEIETAVLKYGCKKLEIVKSSQKYLLECIEKVQRKCNESN